LNSDDIQLLCHLSRDPVYLISWNLIKIGLHTILFLAEI